VSNIFTQKRSRRSFGKVRKLPSGKFQASYVGPDQKRHNAPTTFETKGDANTYLSIMEIKIRTSKWDLAVDDQDKSLTVEAYADPWLADRDLKPRTRALYRNLLHRRILPALGSKPLVNLTASDIRGWHADQAVSQPTARAHAYALLRTILGSAVDDGLIPVNPCRIRSASQSTRQHRIEPATMAQLETIVNNMPERHRLMILLASWCALRFGELTELRRGDFDLSHARVRVTRGGSTASRPLALRSPMLASVMLRSRRTSCPLSGSTCKTMLAGGKTPYSSRPPMASKSGGAEPSKSTGSGHARPLGAMISASTT
jgi:integrase